MDFNINKLNKRIEIVEEKTKNIGGRPKKVNETVATLYAFFDTVWMRDYQMAVTNGTHEQIKIVTRKIPLEINNNTMSIMYNNKQYRIIQVIDDMYEDRFLTFIAELKKI